MSYERWRAWFSEALDDLNVARELLRLRRYSKVCFFSHQASEKALKALMIKRFRRYEVIRSVTELLRRISRGVRVPNELIRAGEVLDRYYIPTRYPNAWPYGAPHEHYNEDEAKKALDYAEKVVRFVEEEIRRDPQ